MKQNTRPLVYSLNKQKYPKKETKETIFLPSPKNNLEKKKKKTPLTLPSFPCLPFFSATIIPQMGLISPSPPMPITIVSSHKVFFSVFFLRTQFFFFLKEKKIVGSVILPGDTTELRSSLTKSVNRFSRNWFSSCRFPNRPFLAFHYLQLRDCAHIITILL